MLVPPNSPVLASARIRDVLRRYLALFAAGAVAPAAGPAVRVCAIAVNGANADIARFRRDLEMLRAVWGRCGIAFAEGGFNTINAAPDYPDWTDFTRAPAALINQRGNCSPTDVRIYYVRSIAGSPFQGRSAFNFGEAGYVAVGDQAHPNLIAHELGHLFLGGNEEHRDGSSPADLVNIMRSDVGSIQGPPQVDQGQCMRAVTAARSGRFVGGGSGQGQMDQTQVMQVLAMAAVHTDAGVRANAATILGQIGGAAAQLILAGALQDPDPTVRAAAISALVGNVAAPPGAS